MRKSVLQIFNFMLFIFLSNYVYLIAQTVYTIHSDQVLHHVDEKIYGQFLEHIYNSVNNGLWGDLIWNRSFEHPSGNGTWYRDGDEIVQSSNNENVRLLFGDVSWQNYEFTLQARKDGGSEGFLILFRANGENFYWCNLGGWGNTLHAIEKGTPGVRWSVFGSQISGSIQTGKWYDIRIRCDGNHFQVWLDGNKLFDFNDNTTTAHLTGQVGIGTWVTQARYRNFLVTDLNGDTLFNEIPTLEGDESPVSNWQKVGTVQMVTNDQALNSNLCVKLINNQQGEAGIEQSGLNLKAQTYKGSFWARGTITGNLTIQLMQGTQVLSEKVFAGLGNDWKEFPFELVPTMETTNGLLRITYSDTGVVYLDQVSMMGQDAIDNNGFRPDLFKAVEALHPPSIRWPGGYYSELYRWKDGIGPQRERVVFPVEAWNDRDVNSFGTDEFITMCRQLNAEPIIVINTGHRYSASPQNQYIQEAKDWVEYCNGPVTSTWGAVRAANGHPEPYNVKYWEMGNEIWLTRSSPSVYVNFLKAFIPALKAVDSSITIIACGGSDFDLNWDKTVIDQCADIIDYISPHHYEGIENYRTGVINYENHTKQLVDMIAASANPYIKIFMSEWNVWSGLDWRSGLYAGGMLTMFERQGEYMYIAAPALFLRHQIATDWNNALINFNNSSWFPGSNYVVMKFWHDHYAPNFLTVDGSNSSLNFSTTKTDDSREIYFKVINTSANNIPVQIKIDGSFQLRVAILEQIAPSSLTSANSMSNPDNIHVEMGNAEIDTGRVRFTVPRYAAVIVTLSQDPNVGLSDDNSINMIKDFNLYQNYPNPFNPSTIIKYDLAQSADIEVNIYDNLGRLIRTYKCGLQNRGTHSIVWNGENQRGDIVPSGTYFYQVNNGQSLLTKKMILLK